MALILNTLQRIHPRNQTSNGKHYIWPTPNSTWYQRTGMARMVEIQNWFQNLMLYNSLKVFSYQISHQSCCKFQKCHFLVVVSFSIPRTNRTGPEIVKWPKPSKGKDCDREIYIINKVISPQITRLSTQKSRAIRTICKRGNCKK